MPVPPQVLEGVAVPSLHVFGQVHPSASAQRVSQDVIALFTEFGGIMQIVLTHPEMHFAPAEFPQYPFLHSAEDSQNCPSSIRLHRKAVPLHAHTPFAQSPRRYPFEGSHTLPIAHLVVQATPQSTSVSGPDLTPSEQVPHVFPSAMYPAEHPNPLLQMHPSGSLHVSVQVVSEVLTPSILSPPQLKLYPATVLTQLAGHLQLSWSEQMDVQSVSVG